MFKCIAKLFKFVIAFLKESHEPLAAIYYLQSIIEHSKLADTLQTLSSIEWPTLVERLHDILMLIQSYF